jgi:branched-chain amino acid transport system ATP-binding protein
MSDMLVESRGLTAGYGGVAAIVDVNLRVDAGERVALLGANGAGKTTTMLALLGWLRPMAGEIEMFGQRGASLLSRARSGLAFLPEQKSIFMNLTVRENLMLGRGRVDDALYLFPELEPKLREKAGLVSGGEQQMLSLARILAAKPRLILADELSLGLAPMIVRRLLAALASAVDEYQAGVLIVEQQVQTALRWADRAYVMRRGRVDLAGQSPQLLERIEEVTSLYL